MSPFANLYWRDERWAAPKPLGDRLTYSSDEGQS